MEHSNLSRPLTTVSRANEIDRIKAAVDAYRSLPAERTISAMPVIVAHTAVIRPGLYHFKNDDQHTFAISRIVRDGVPIDEWEEKPLNAHAVMDQFFKVKDWSEAYDFLSSTGKFSDSDLSVKWSEFQQWQYFARLVRQRTQLVSAMQEGAGGEYDEVFKALSGIYPSSLFKYVPPSASHGEWLEDQKRRNPEFARAMQFGKELEEQDHLALMAWFRRPPRQACSIEWVPKDNEDLAVVVSKLQAAEWAMIEFLLPRDALRPVLVIHTSNTIEAIAAAIFADFSNGVEYRTCDFCGQLFAVGKQKSKRFCNQRRCKNAAHSRKIRKQRRQGNGGGKGNDDGTV